MINYILIFLFTAFDPTIEGRSIQFKQIMSQMFKKPIDLFEMQEKDRRKIEHECFKTKFDFIKITLPKFIQEQKEISQLQKENKKLEIRELGERALIYFELLNDVEIGLYSIIPEGQSELAKKDKKEKYQQNFSIADLYALTQNSRNESIAYIANIQQITGQVSSFILSYNDELECHTDLIIALSRKILEENIDQLYKVSYFICSYFTLLVETSLDSDNVDELKVYNLGFYLLSIEPHMSEFIIEGFFNILKHKTVSSVMHEECLFKPFSDEEFLCLLFPKMKNTVDNLFVEKMKYLHPKQRDQYLDKLQMIAPHLVDRAMCLRNEQQIFKNQYQAPDQVCYEPLEKNTDDFDYNEGATSDYQSSSTENKETQSMNLKLENDDQIQGFEQTSTENQNDTEETYGLLYIPRIKFYDSSINCFSWYNPKSEVDKVNQIIIEENEKWTKKCEEVPTYGGDCYDKKYADRIQKSIDDAIKLKLEILIDPILKKIGGEFKIKKNSRRGWSVTYKN